jgi:hypothetical protein
MLMRRRGAPLVRAAVGTAVIAGTAGAVRHHQEQKWAGQQAQQDAMQQDAYEQGMAAAQQQQQYTAPPPAPAPAAGGVDMEQLKQLAELHSAGVLNDEEFAAAKAKLLGS